MVYKVEANTGINTSGMTSWMTLSGDIRQNLTFKETSGIFARIFTKQWIKIYFSPCRMLTTWRGDCARMIMSRMETRASSLINCFIFVDCHWQRIISVYEDTNVH